MLAGYATGSVPYGYRTRPELDARGREIGKQIEIVEDAAKIVIRILTEFANGRGPSAIARMLNREGIPSPRIGTRHRWSGGPLERFARCFATSDTSACGASSRCSG